MVVLLCIGTQKGVAVLRAVLPYREQYDFHVCTFAEEFVVDSYKAEITRLAEENDICVISLGQFRDGLLEYVKSQGVGAIVCAGWRYLVPPEVVRELGGEVIIAHDSLLPKFRGFAPMPTALIIGERESGVSFLRVGRGVDDGDILWQGRFDIGREDTIQDLIDKSLLLYGHGARAYLEGGFGSGVPQQEDKASYSLWRDDIDYIIDWTLDANTIERTVRALGPPYLGAKFFVQGEEVIVRRATVMPDLKFAIRQPGKIWTLDEIGRPLVVCGVGLLRIDSADKEGESIIPFKRLRTRLG